MLSWRWGDIRTPSVAFIILKSSWGASKNVEYHWVSFENIRIPAGHISKHLDTIRWHFKILELHSVTFRKIRNPVGRVSNRIPLGCILGWHGPRRQGKKLWWSSLIGLDFSNNSSLGFQSHVILWVPRGPTDFDFRWREEFLIFRIVAMCLFALLLTIVDIAHKVWRAPLRARVSQGSLDSNRVPKNAKSKVH